MVAVLSLLHILNQIFQLSMYFFFLLLCLKKNLLISEQKKKEIQNKTWSDTTGSLMATVSHFLRVDTTASEPLSPILLGWENTSDISLNFRKGKEISRPVIYLIYFPTLRSIRRSCCCLFTLFPLAQRKWPFQGRAVPPTPWQDREGDSITPWEPTAEGIFSLNSTRRKGSTSV